MNYLDSLGDGWTIYLWLVAGALIIIASIYGIRWASRNEQFDEDIKYLIFTESDKDKMTTSEYLKSRKVLEEQVASHERRSQAGASNQIA